MGFPDASDRETFVVIALIGALGTRSSSDWKAASRQALSRLKLDRCRYQFDVNRII